MPPNRSSGSPEEVDCVGAADADDDPSDRPAKSSSPDELELAAGPAFASAPKSSKSIKLSGCAFVLVDVTPDLSFDV